MTTQKSAFSFDNAIQNPFMRALDQKNPFVVAASDDVPENAPEGSYTYAIVKTAPEVPAAEVETQAMAVELVISWGTSVLAIEHLSPVRDFVIGEDEAGKKADFLVSEDKIGQKRFTLVRAAGDKATLEIPASAKGSVTSEGKKQAIAAGASIALTEGVAAELEIGGLTFKVATVKAARKIAGGVRLDNQSLPYAGLSLLVHASLLAAAAFFMPNAAMADSDEISNDQRYYMTQALKTIAEREQDKRDEGAVDDSKKKDDGEGGKGARAKNEEGKMGSDVSKNKSGRYAIAGDKDNKDVHIGRNAAIDDAMRYTIIGVLNSGLGGDPNAPRAAWGRDDSFGNDAVSKLGNMWGPNIDDAAGAGGLGLTGVGEGGGGIFEGVGLGRDIATIGHGSGCRGTNGCGDGFGNGGVRLSKGHKVTTPVVRVGTSQVNGHLPSEVIQRVVRQNFGRFKFCYQDGLRSDPSLQGRVTVRFVIGRDGAISSVQNGGSDLPNAGVVSCVVRAFYGLSFPAPESGIVTVTYPIVFSPSN